MRKRKRKVNRLDFAICRDNGHRIYIFDRTTSQSEPFIDAGRLCVCVCDFLINSSSTIYQRDVTRSINKIPTNIKCVSGLHKLIRWRLVIE